jgi:stage IV sporulation protein B
MGRSIRAAAAAVWLALLLTVPALAAEPETLVPVGRAVGLELETDGVYVVSLEGGDGGSPAETAGLRAGDRILAANGQRLTRAEELRDLAARSGGAAVILDVERGGRAMQFAVRPAERDGAYCLGLRVRDRIAGLGTVTFYDPETGLFGALGHGVGGGDCPLEIRSGAAMEAEVTEVRRGEAGTPGSLLGQAVGGETLGTVEQNTDRGLFGHWDTEALSGQAVPLADTAEVTTGPAEIWCCAAGSEVLHYAVEIEAVRFDDEGCRDLRLAVTDPRLLEQTGGIVQGMSGSPILQNGKLVGAVTHVLVRDPTRGYGILIGHMLEAAAEAKAA